MAGRRRELGLAEESDVPESAEAEGQPGLGLAEEGDAPEPAEAGGQPEHDVTEEADASDPAEAHQPLATVDGDGRLVPPPAAQPHDPIESGTWQKRGARTVRGDSPRTATEIARR